MWNFASQAGTGVAIAGLSATYYALIRKNVEMENRAMDDLAAEIPKDEKRNGSKVLENVCGSRSEYRMPTTASQNLLRQNFQLMAKESGRIYGINVAHSDALLVERNRSESDIDHIVNRTETFASKSAVALSGAHKSKSDFDVLKKFRYGAIRKESSLDLNRSRSVFDMDTFPFRESSTETLSLNQGDASIPMKVCHCKYSASAEDIHDPPSSKAIEPVTFEKDEKVEIIVPKTQSPTVGVKTSTRKQMQGSFLSEDYVPRLENREFGVYNLPLPATSSSKRTYPYQDKDADNSTQVIFHPEKHNFSKIPRFLRKGLSKNSGANNENDSGKSLLENTEKVCNSPYERNNDDEFPPAEKLLPLKFESELGGPLIVPDNILRYSTSDLKSSKQDYISSEHPSSSMFSLPDQNSFSFTVEQQQNNTEQPPSVQIKESNYVFIQATASTNSNHSPCMLELGTRNTFPLVQRPVKTSIYAVLGATNRILNMPVGVVAFFILVFIAFAIFAQIIIEVGLFQDLVQNPADSAFPEQTML